MTYVSDTLNEEPLNATDLSLMESDLPEEKQPDDDFLQEETFSEFVEESNTTANISLALKDHLTPKEIVAELDQDVIGQQEAKRVIARALRERIRRTVVDDERLRKEIQSNNILMIGPSGVGKTAICYRAANLTEDSPFPFLKVEATKYTEVGYIGRDVDSIIRDLVDSAYKTLRQKTIEGLEKQVKEAVEERILNAFLKTSTGKVDNKVAFSELKQSERGLARNLYRRRLQEGLLDEKEIEVELTNHPMGVEIMGPPGMEEMTNQLQSMMQNLNSGRVKTHRMKIKDAFKVLQQEEADKLLNEEDLKRRAVDWVEKYGIVFIDEIDKVCRRGEIGGADVSREGVQRDLLPLLGGSTVSTKYGMVRTHHILFIAAGAFQSGQKPSDLIPELQGRLPVRVELHPLKIEDFIAILCQCRSSLLVQSQALLETEGLTVKFSDEAISRIAEIAFNVNEKVENIGARRLNTVMERLLESLSFDANELAGQTVTIDATYVNDKLTTLIDNEDSSHYIL